MVRHRIGIDGVLLRRPGKGVSRFLTCFLEAFSSSNIVGVELVVFVDRNAPLPALPTDERIEYCPVSVGRQLVWDVLHFQRCLDRANLQDALVISDRVRLRGRYVSYLFEIPDYRIAAQRPWASSYQRLSDAVTRLRFRSTISNASRVITSSQSTRSDLLSKYNLPSNRVLVVYPAPAPRFAPTNDPAARTRVQNAYSAPNGYWLHFSSDGDPRDNTGRVVLAFARAAQQAVSKRLLIVGVEALRSFGWGEVAASTGVADQIQCLGFVNDQQLVELYRGADALIDVSHYEGFGFQVAEALACGLPIVCSNVTSLPELVGNAAILTSPLNVAGIADGMVSIATSETLAHDLSQKGRERAARFSWQTTVAETLAVFAGLSL